ncbi:MAG: amidohydrolase [Saprospiraceae bacterium]|nr:amidohydrolase [Saprospiraceae bacterium]
MNSKPLINVHTHIFTSEDVPRYIAKGVFPFYWLLDLRKVIPIAKIYFKCKPFFHRLNRHRRNALSAIRSRWFLHILYTAGLVWLSLNALYFLVDYAKWDFSAYLPDWAVFDLAERMLKKYLLLEQASAVLRTAMIATAYAMFKPLRQLMWKFLVMIFQPLRSIPRDQIAHFWHRYKNIIRFATYKNQAGVFDRLHKMYPPLSKMVVLPMDMEFMGAGAPQRSYLQQLEDLHGLAIGKTRRDVLVPFLFVDPRRIRHDRKIKTSNPFFDWEVQNGKVCLKPCLVKKYLEDDNGGRGVFKGIKIYPALGYYPFDEDLLPLWLYCQDHEIPITTHCIMGSIYSRARLHRKQLHHPYLTKNGKSLRLRHITRYEAQRNFTQPLNYALLLEPRHLHQWLSRCRTEIADLFYSEGGQRRDLSGLKINLAHYGGPSEWAKYLEQDRLEPSQELIEMPNIGVSFRYKQVDAAKNNPTLFYNERLADLWQSGVDWFSLINSLMMQYPNVYADISYTLHDPVIKPLLSRNMQHPRLRRRILFGTDYYVVRQHDTEKGLFLRLLEGLDKDDIELLIRQNPTEFLSI